MPGKIYLIPTLISEDSPKGILPPYISEIIGSLRVFIVEDEKGARAFLRKADPAFSFEGCVFFVLNEHSSAKEAEEIFKNIADKDAGVLSESGCPCVADPGADIVWLAHKHNREVLPLVGPSSIILALMASGLSGQNFAFNGYLPKEKEARLQKIKGLERRAQTESQTQIFMEAPHHNQNLLNDILSTCDAETQLCVACDLTGADQLIKTLPIKLWKKENISIHKKPTLFLIQCQGGQK